jgi:hypothetical protein
VYVSAAATPPTMSWAAWMWPTPERSTSAKQLIVMSFGTTISGLPESYQPWVST